MTAAKRDRYDRVAMLLHWIAAALMIFMVFIGEELMEVEKDGMAGTVAPSLHVSLGATILVLTVLRLAWRIANPPPPYPAKMKAWETTVSKIIHLLFYVLMLGLPLTGWLAFSEFLREAPSMSGVSVWGMFPVPAAPSFGEFAGGVHDAGSKIVMLLIILHVLAALKHQFIDRDGILRRMSPH